MNGGRESQPVGTRDFRRLPNRYLDELTEPRDVRHGVTREDEYEFLSAVLEHHPNAFGHRRQSVRALEQNRTTNSVAARIVDPLEPIYVDQDQRDGIATCEGSHSLFQEEFFKLSTTRKRAQVGVARIHREPSGTPSAPFCAEEDAHRPSRQASRIVLTPGCPLSAVYASAHVVHDRGTRM